MVEQANGSSAESIDSRGVMIIFWRFAEARGKQPLAVEGLNVAASRHITTTRGSAQPTGAPASFKTIGHQSSPSGTSRPFHGVVSWSLPALQQPLQTYAVAMRGQHPAPATQRHRPLSVRPRLEMHDVIDVHDRRPADADELRRVQLPGQ